MNETEFSENEKTTLKHKIDNEEEFVDIIMAANRVLKKKKENEMQVIQRIRQYALKIPIFEPPSSKKTFSV